jgi:hypothetical protein
MINEVLRAIILNGTRPDVILDMLGCYLISESTTFAVGRENYFARNVSCDEPMGKYL